MLNVDKNSIEKAEVILNTSLLNEEIFFLENEIGFKLKEIYPADSPKFALLEGFGLNIVLKLEKENSKYNLTHIRVRLDKSSKKIKSKLLTSPGGNKVEFIIEQSYEIITKFPNSIEINQNTHTWNNGRAGMLYRDLLPSRYGGYIIASHIKLDSIGKVHDRVHYHNIDFQVLYCLKGKVKLAYENQNNYIMFNKGDCILQPPQIKHQVIETYEPLEVIEITSPAEHVTKINYDLKIPNKDKTSFDEKTKSFFLHYKYESQGIESILPGFNEKKMGIYEASAEFADLIILESDNFNSFEFLHRNKILFIYVLDGSIKIIDDITEHSLNKNDCFTLPPNKKVSLFYLKTIKLLLLSISGKLDIKVFK